MVEGSGAPESRRFGAMISKEKFGEHEKLKYVAELH